MGRAGSPSPAGKVERSPNTPHGAARGAALPACTTAVGPRIAARDDLQYACIYPRLTTKSNVFTVYMTVQVLRKARTTEAGTWKEGEDRVLAEYRGSATIERYIDPTRDDLPDFLHQRTFVDRRLDEFYEFRIVNTKQFAP